jgi:hypothetical protein
LNRRGFSAEKNEIFDFLFFRAFSKLYRNRRFLQFRNSVGPVKQGLTRIPDPPAGGSGLERVSYKEDGFWIDGGLAQLARACDWQSQGQGFDSPNLHPNNEAVMKLSNDCLFYLKTQSNTQESF